MLSIYPAMCHDKSGAEVTTIQNDGQTLRMVIRGVEFSGTSFDTFDPPKGCTESELKSFDFFLGSLCSCEIDCEIPVEVVDGDHVIQGTLRAHYEFGEPDNSRGIRTARRTQNGHLLEESRSLNSEILQLELIFGGKSFKSSGQNLYAAFDEQLSEINDLLPEDVYLRTCWTCAFADYHPVGSGSFGGLACFRNCKNEYRRVRTKSDLMALWGKRAEFVQEIHLCPEFEKRQPGMGWHWPPFEKRKPG